jgi:hypothetical protein
MYFSKKKLSPGVITLLTVIGQGSHKSMHIYTMWSSFVPSFIEILQSVQKELQRQYLSKKKLKLRALTPSKIIEQGSPYNIDTI